MLRDIKKFRNVFIWKYESYLNPYQFPYHPQIFLITVRVTVTLTTFPVWALPHLHWTSRTPFFNYGKSGPHPHHLPCLSLSPPPREFKDLFFFFNYGKSSGSHPHLPARPHSFGSGPSRKDRESFYWIWRTPSPEVIPPKIHILTLPA